MEGQKNLLKIKNWAKPGLYVEEALTVDVETEFVMWKLNLKGIRP